MTTSIKENVMRTPKISKVTLSSGAVDKELEKAAKLLELLSQVKVQIIKSGPDARIPAFNVKPDMPLGARATIRGRKATLILAKLLGGIYNTIKARQVSENTLSFGIADYMEIPGVEYVREIGIRGLNITVTFERPGVRVKRKKIKRGRVPKRQHVTKEEIIKYMEDNFKTKFE